MPGVRPLAYPTPGHGAADGADQNDLAVDATGRVRPGWDRVLTALAGLGPAELARRQRAADRLMRAEGAGIVLHEDADQPLRPWGIDMVPLVIGGDTWAGLAAGLIERAELLAAVLSDLLGPRTLLHAGVVPVEALVAHATTLRSAWNGASAGRPSGSRAAAGAADDRLLVAGADVVLGADGRGQVVSDATGVPGGEGYAHLARSISERVLPRTELSPAVAGHGGYLAELRGALARAAPPGRASPRTVVVTGAPDSPGYVEDAHLATQLGYHLAELADIVVRGGRAWLRSLEGPEPVEVLFRRVHDTALDPVEDEQVAGAGVAGAVEAVRGGRLAIVNPYGADVTASPALLPFIDAAARFLNGRDLRLPTVPSLWCGDPERRREVAAAPERFVLYDTEPRRPGQPAAVAQLADQEVAAVLARLDAQPERYVAQPALRPATAPGLAATGELRPAAVSLRTQVLLAGDRPLALPGGHGRVVDDGAPIAGRERGVGKDVWVLERPSRPRVRLRRPPDAVPQVDLRRSVPTRAAEAMYWAGRTAERAEMAARTVLVALTRLPGAEPGGEPDLDDTAAACRALRATSGGMAAEVSGTSLTLDVEREVRQALAGRPGAVVDSLRATVANARAARQLLSPGTWRLLAMLDAEGVALGKLAGDAGAGLDRSGLATFDATEALDRVLVPLAALAGLANESVVRGPGWRFLDIGRRIERSLLVLGLVEALFEPAAAGPPSAVRGDLALTACESLVAYRRRYRSDVTLDALGDLLLADRDNPRSVRFQLDQLVVDLHDLPDRPVRRTQIAAVRDAQRILESRLPLGAGGDRAGLGPVGALVIAVREPLLRAGDLVPAGWFSERPRRLR